MAAQQCFWANGEGQNLPLYLFGLNPGWMSGIVGSGDSGGGGRGILSRNMQN